MAKATPIPLTSRVSVRVRADDRCERCGAGAKNGHWHHRRSRSVRDELTHSEFNGVLLCSTCHNWVHANPFLARGQGWIVSRYADPRTIPIEHYSLGLVMLMADSKYGAA